MNPAHHPLFGVKAMLQDIAGDGDAARLAGCLEGKYLPALGGHQHPADILHRALSMPPYDPGLGEKLTGLTAELTEHRVEALAGSLEASSRLVSASTETVTVASPAEELLEDELYVFNLFLLASLLPAAEPLFHALKEFHKVGLRTSVLSSGSGRVGRQLRQALMYQQVDDSLGAFWFGLIEQVANRPGRAIAESLSREEKGDLLDAWRGLLWIPPTSADREAARTVSIERILEGLGELDEAVGEQVDGLPVLRYAVRQLSEAYPRSPEFWSEHLARWPNDGVPRHGLANILRKRQCFQDALALLPMPTKIVTLRHSYDLHLRGMILLESGATDLAMEAFERGLDEAPHSPALFRRSLTVARLKQKHYQEVLMNLREASSVEPEDRVLEFHAAAGAGQAQVVKALQEEYAGNVLAFPQPVRECFELITASWGIGSEEGFREPTEDQLEDVSRAEIEMVLARAA